jgi:arylformamidase
MLIDLSHTVEHGMITYKGLPAPVISDHLSREASRNVYEAGTEFNIGTIEMVANTGTYLDSPFHRYEDGRDLSALDLASLANLESVLVHHDSTRRIDAETFSHLDVKGKAVLVHTGWDQHWRTDHYSNGEHPFLTEDAANHLVNEGAVLVGIDSFNIDDTSTKSRSVHSTLLKNNVLIVEHLRGLDQLPDNGFKFFAVPVKVKAFGTFPVRAFALIP